MISIFLLFQELDFDYFFKVEGQVVCKKFKVQVQWLKGKIRLGNLVSFFLDSKEINDLLRLIGCLVMESGLEFRYFYFKVVFFLQFL